LGAAAATVALAAGLFFETVGVGVELQPAIIRLSAVVVIAIVRGCFMEWRANGW